MDSVFDVIKGIADLIKGLWFLWLVVFLIAAVIWFLARKSVRHRAANNQPAGSMTTLEEVFGWLAKLTLALLVIGSATWLLEHSFYRTDNVKPQPSAQQCKVYDTFKIKGDGVLKSDGYMVVAWSDDQGNWTTILSPGDYDVADVTNGTVYPFDTDCSKDDIVAYMAKNGIANESVVSTHFDRTGDFTPDDNGGNGGGGNDLS